MPLGFASRLGNYHVVAPLGAGGMGEVYRARDPKLDRDVAIKVLPARLTESQDALARFEREARAVAALSHPNVLAIHDFGTHEGTAYAVMELLEGETLRQRLAGGALPVRKAVDYATQIARGLAAAHDKGIVHRDLKPENLFVTEDGRVKVLDFGLARQAEPAADSREGDTPTVSRHTEPGTVLGTVGYMSPEQVRGETADARSDIFSFGCVLYEMLAGRRAFQRDTAAETMAAVLKDEPPALTGTLAEAAPRLVQIVERCLEKRRSSRFQSASDLAFHLETLSGVSQEGVSGPRAALRRRRAARPAAAMLLVLGVGMAVGFLLSRWWRPAGQPTFTPLTFRRGHVSSARFTPDGHTVVYGAMWEGGPIQAFSTRIGSSEYTTLALPPADVLSVSPSGELALSLGRRFTDWFESSGRLARAPMAGGAPRELLDDVMEASWAPGGRELLVVRKVEGRCRLELGGRVLHSDAGWLSHARVSPDGSTVAFIEHPFGGADNGRVCVVPASGQGDKTVVSRDFASAQGLAWHPERREIWFTAAEGGGNSALRATTLEGKERLVLRTPGRLRLHDVDAGGRVLLTSERSRIGSIVGSVGDGEERDVSWLDTSFAFSLSSDGRKVLIDEQGDGAGARYGLYLRDTVGSPAVRLGDGFLAALSPDDRWVLTMSQDEPQRLTVLPTGPGESRTLPAAGLTYQSLGWFRDGKRIAFGAVEPGRRVRLYSQDLAGGSPQPFTDEGFGVGNIHLPVSPDGRWAAALGHDERAYLCPTAGGAPQPLAGLEPGDMPLRFSGDGSALYCARVGMVEAAIVRLDLATRKRSVWKTVRPQDATGIFTLFPSDVTPDGRSYVYIYARMLSELFLVEGLR